MLLRKLFDQFTDLNYLFGIKTDRWLIENDHFGIPKDCLGKTHPLFITFGKISDQSLCHIRDHGHIHHFLNLSFFFLSFYFFQLGNELQILFYCHFLIKRRDFRKVPDTLLSFLRVFYNIITIDCHRSFGRCYVTCHDIHSGALSRPIRSEETVYFSRLYLKGKMIHRKVIAISLYKIVYFYQSKTPPLYFVYCQNKYLHQHVLLIIYALFVMENV